MLMLVLAQEEGGPSGSWWCSSLGQLRRKTLVKTSTSRFSPPPVQGDERFGSEIKLKLLSSIHTVLLEILSVLWCVL